MRVVVCDGILDFGDCRGALLDEQWSAVEWRNVKEEERATTSLVEYIDLAEQSVHKRCVETALGHVCLAHR